MSINARSPFGAPKYASGSPVPASVATLTALKAVTELGDLIHGNEVLVDADQSRWYWHSTSALTGDDILVVTPTNAAGRWLRAQGAVRLVLPITYATADAAVLATLPTGAQMKIENLYWEITADFTGGSSSAIGVSSAKTGFSTKGDLLGGASGDELERRVYLVRKRVEHELGRKGAGRGAQDRQRLGARRSADGPDAFLAKHIIGTAGGVVSALPLVSSFKVAPVSA